MELKELTDFCRAEALSNKLLPTNESVWRIICRNYSKKFNEPLTSCLNGTIDPEQIILNLYEDQLDDIDEEENIEKLLDVIYDLEDPEYEAQKEEMLKQVDEDAEKEEQERLAKGKPIHPSMKREVSTKMENPVEQPKSGSIDLSYFHDSKNEG